MIDTNRPRIEAGLISAMYIGERLDAKPMPMPPTNRAMLNVAKSQAAAVRIALSVNRKPATMSGGFRPKRSDSMPETAAPTKQPMSAVLSASVADLLAHVAQSKL